MLARVLTCSKSCFSSAPLLKHLHWLPVLACIHFRIALLTFKSLHTIAPSYLSSLIQPYVLSRALHSSSAHRLCVPHVRTVLARVVSDRPVQQSGIPCRFQLRLAPPSILSRNSSRRICLPQPSPLVELSLMLL